MLLLVIVALLAAAVCVIVVRLQSGLMSAGHGWMSHHWLAEYRASHAS